MLDLFLKKANNLKFLSKVFNAGVAELVDARDSNSRIERCGGSSPPPAHISKFSTFFINNIIIKKLAFVIVKLLL